LTSHNTLRGRCPATPYELNKIQRKSPNIKANSLKLRILLWKSGFAPVGARVFGRRGAEFECIRRRRDGRGRDGAEKRREA
jgi:hypothetical protein